MHSFHHRGNILVTREDALCVRSEINADVPGVDKLYRHMVTRAKAADHRSVYFKLNLLDGGMYFHILAI